MYSSSSSSYRFSFIILFLLHSMYSGCSEKYFLLLISFLFVVVILITFLAFLVHGCNSVLSRQFFFFGGASHSLMPFLLLFCCCEEMALLQVSKLPFSLMC